MNIDAAIDQAIQRLADLQRQVQQLQQMGVSPKAEVFDVLAAAAWRECYRWEVLAFMDWEERYYIHDTKNIFMN